MAIVTELKQDRFALNLGEPIKLVNAAQRGISFKKVGPKKYEMVFKVNFEVKKEFEPGNAENNKFSETDGSLAVLKKGDATASNIGVDFLKFYYTSDGELHMELDVKVPNGDKGNHG